MTDRLKALVIAGGTEEPIDDVRVITNRSTGRFGAAIANELVVQGYQTTLLASPRLRQHPDWLNNGIRVQPFSSFKSLESALNRYSKQEQPDLVFMAAAVADYSPSPHSGKLTSTNAELTIRLSRNPKLLHRLRDQFGDSAYLVGFKLLSGVTDDELVAVARQQIADNRLDLCVANDASSISDTHHPIYIVSPTRDVTRAAGSKNAIARDLVSFVLNRRSHQSFD